MSRPEIDAVVAAIHAADEEEARAIEAAVVAQSDNRPHAGDPVQPEEER